MPSAKMSVEVVTGSLRICSGLAVFRREHRYRFRAGAESGIEKLRDAEVQQLDGSGFGDQDVAGFEIAMNRKVAVRVFHRVADLQEQVQPLADAEVVDPAIFGDGNAIHELHDEVRIAAGSGVRHRGWMRYGDDPVAPECAAHAQSGAERDRRQ